jgi:hypothetical protein
MLNRPSHTGSTRRTQHTSKFDYVASKLLNAQAVGADDRRVRSGQVLIPTTQLVAWRLGGANGEPEPQHNRRLSRASSAMALPRSDRRQRREW